MNTSMLLPTFAIRCADPHGDIERLARAELQRVAIKGHDSEPGNHEPMFSTPSVPLVAQATARAHLDPLHLVGAGLLQDFVGAPRPFLPLPIHHTS